MYVKTGGVPRNSRKMDFAGDYRLRSEVMERYRLRSCLERFPFLLALAALLLAAPLDALGEKPLTGTLPTLNPRAIALGQTLRASASGTSGLYLNPAVIAMTPLYHLELMYQYTGKDNMHMGGVSLVDSVTTVVAAGVAFNYSDITEKRTKHQAFDGRLAIAGGIGNVFYLGATGRYLYLEQNQSESKWGPAGKPALPSSGSRQVNGFTFDAGAALRLGSIVTLGLVGYNLIPSHSIFAPMDLGTGLSLYLLSMLLLEANVVIDFTSHDRVNTEIHFGTELFLAKAVAIRLGYIYDIYYDLHSLSAGLAYIHPKFSIDLGFMHEVIEDGRWQLGFSFKYFVN